MTEQQREAFEQWVVSQFPGHALDEIDPGALDLARSAYEQGALSHAEGEAVPVDIDAEYEAFCQWCRESGFNLDYRLHTHSGRRVSDGAYIRDENARRMFRAWRERAAHPAAQVAPVPWPKREDITEDMRAGFERLYREKAERDGRTLERNEQGAYAHLPVQADWIFYQRAWADALEAKAPQVACQTCGGSGLIGERPTHQNPDDAHCEPCPDCSEAAPQVAVPEGLRQAAGEAIAAIRAIPEKRLLALDNDPHPPSTLSAAAEALENALSAPTAPAGLTETAIKSSPAYRSLCRSHEHLLGLLVEHARNHDDDERWDEAAWHERVVGAVGDRLESNPTAPAGEPVAEHNQRRVDPFTERQIKEAIAEGRVNVGSVGHVEQPVSDPDGLLEHCAEFLERLQVTRIPEGSSDFEEAGSLIGTIGVRRTAPAPDEREIAALREDAERYRFWREVLAGDDKAAMDLFEAELNRDVASGNRPPTGEELDKAVDVARRLRAGKEGEDHA